MPTISQTKIFRDFSTSDRPQTSKTNQDQQRVKTPRSFYTASVDLTRSPNRPATPALCAFETSGVLRRLPPNWQQADRSFDRLEENASGVPEEEFSVPDVAGEHGVAGVPCLLPDLERRDARLSRARREAGA
jgi:hypothetical protein